MKILYLQYEAVSDHHRDENVGRPDTEYYSQLHHWSGIAKVNKGKNEGKYKESNSKKAHR